jgi:hypothetical protein
MRNMYVFFSALACAVLIHSAMVGAQDPAGEASGVAAENAGTFVPKVRPNDVPGLVARNGVPIF